MLLSAKARYHLSSVGYENFCWHNMKNPTSHNLFSLRQAAQLTGNSYRTLCNYIDQRKIDFLQIDHFRAISQDEIDRIIDGGIISEPKRKLEGHKTIVQAARILNINIPSLKNYVKEERIDNIKKYDIYFIADETVDKWLEVPEPRNPNTVEAHYLGAVIIREAARALGQCDSGIRQLIAAGQLDIVKGFCRRYVTKGSIQAYIEIREMIEGL